MFSSREHVAEQDIVLCLKEKLDFEPKRYKDRINLDNDIMIDK